MNKIAVQPGMGAIVHDEGVAFRVWAPHAKAVTVIGDFNDWDPEANPLEHEENGYWAGNVPKAKEGDEYLFHLTLDKRGKKTVTRIDPYARQVTNSIGNGVIYAGDFDWTDDGFQMAPWNELVIYEMHVGTYIGDGDKPGGLKDVLSRLDHLIQLGVNCVQLMPVAEFSGDISWGYSPSHIFAVESAYGGPQALKKFVNELHAHGIAVVLDVVYNHFGPSDLDLWRFDGWYENDGGGIYFYNDWRAETPWGHTRPDYGREEVCNFLHDNVFMWLSDYHMDGLRFDGTAFIRKKDLGDAEIEEGRNWMQRVNQEIAEQYPGKLLIAEDLQNDAYVTQPVDEGGLGFSVQWDATFVHTLRETVITPDDDARSMSDVAALIGFRYNIDSFERVIYSESHDEVANGKARVPYEIDRNDPEGWFAQKRSTLAASLVFTAPGIPMLFQGQELLQGEWFRDDVPLDWSHHKEYHSIVHLYHDLIHLRRNLDGTTRGLCGQHIDIFLADEEHKLIGFRRWDTGGPGDDVIVVANFRNSPFEGQYIPFPAPGHWKLRFNSDASLYSDIFEGKYSGDVTAQANEENNEGNGENEVKNAASALIDIAPYSVLIYSQDPA